ncbi:pyridoxal-phosphate-dependent aminotransferase family protein [Candidatus Kryptobacter tengchongensis]|uniref:Aspartate aminotransferase n=1 Tax=Kryptobacter tengchongensis TaxID=1643429 RepID=A0A916LIX6_KRYT1|nr:alanine--glyoxylate aminotransferase family protein [Candidatus Kryptobacter tengchongensis]CUS97893.1 aspartate aminotransferase [Candidatus Kryptobacter tengchongensis]
MKKRLFTPGPTPVPENVALAMAQPIIHHRNPEFIEIFARVNENLKYLFQTKQDVYTLTSSGTGAMEAAVANLFSYGDKVIFVNGGKFGERWGEICRAYGVEAIEVKIEWGRAVTPEEIKEQLKKYPDVKAVLVTHSETSTGVFTDVKELSRIVHENSDAVIVVDGITSVGAHELYMDEWGLDVVITGSQKGLMIPPGLSFIALSEKAWEMVESSNLPKYYFSLKKAKKALQNGDTPWTPAIALIVALDVALKMIKEEGLENIWRRHEKLSKAVREGCKAIGLKLFGEPPSYAVTAVYFPDGIDKKEFQKTLKYKYGVTVAGGQEHLKDKIFRISHLGYYDEIDIIGVISAIEMALLESGFDEFNPGDGVRAVQSVFAEYEKSKLTQNDDEKFLSCCH